VISRDHATSARFRRRRSASPDAPHGGGWLRQAITRLVEPVLGVLSPTRRTECTLEALETRQMLSVSYGSHMTLNDTGGSSEAQITSLLTNTNAGSFPVGSSVSFSGSVVSSDHTSEIITGSFQITEATAYNSNPVTAPTFTLTATNASPTAIEYDSGSLILAKAVAANGAGGSFSLAHNQVSGTFTGLMFTSDVQQPMVNSVDTAPTVSLAWNSAGSDNHIQIQLVGATLPVPSGRDSSNNVQIEAGQVIKGSFYYEAGSNNTVLVTSSNSSAEIDLGRGAPTDPGVDAQHPFVADPQVILTGIANLQWNVSSNGIVSVNSPAATGTSLSVPNTPANQSIAFSGSYTAKFDTVPPQ